MLSVALSLIRRRQGYGGPPGVTRHRYSVEPGLSSPLACARAAAARSPGTGHIGGTAGFFESLANFTNFMGTDAIFVKLVMAVRGIPCPVDDAKEPAFHLTPEQL